MNNERVLAYVDTILGIVEKDVLIDKTVEFLVQEFKLSNCSIHMFSEVRRFYDGSKESLDSIEGDIWRQVSEAKISLSADITKEWPGKTGMAKYVCAIPWVQDRQLKGLCCLYSDVPVAPLAQFVQTVIDKLGRAVVTANQYHQVQISAVTDKLTGLYNRGYFMEAIERELQRARVDKKPTSLLIFDIDDFKKYNDTYGHPEGDQILVKVADCLRHNVRPGDIACRYGGEEFVIILPGANTDASFKRAEHLRQAVQDSSPLTISIGVVSCLNSSASAETLLKEADKAMYKAKETGKNRTVNSVIVDKNLGVIDVQDANNIGTF